MEILRRKILDMVNGPVGGLGMGGNLGAGGEVLRNGSARLQTPP